VSSPKVEILIVDDSDEIAEAMAMMLSDEGYETRVAHNGRVALEAVKLRRPALILTDGLMPTMSGLELLTALRSDLAPPVPPVIVVSGFPAIEKDALGRGAVDFLHKPVSPAELVAAVARVLAQRACPPEVAERARQRAREARREISAAARAVFAEIDRAGGKFRGAAARVTEWLVGYYGFGTAIVVTICPDAIERLAEARGPDAGIVTARAAEPFLRDIAETRSSLLVGDADGCVPAFTSLAHTGAIRFFAGVPYVAADGTAIGALALLDTAPHAFAAGDLRLLEHVGRTGSDGINSALTGRLVRPPDTFVDEDGILSGRSFKTFFTAELDLAVHCGAGVALGIAALDGSPRWRPHGQPCGEARVRLGVGRLAADRLGYFKRDPSVNRAAAVLGAALDAHADGNTHASAAVLTLGPDAVALVDARMALELTESAAAEAGRRGGILHLALSVEHGRPSVEAR
jgi:two-component system phosphate regulon response regulator PhoB